MKSYATKEDTQCNKKYAHLHTNAKVEMLVHKLTYHLLNSKLSIKVPNITEPNVFKWKSLFIHKVYISPCQFTKKNIPGPGWNTVDKLKSNIMVFYGKVYAASIPLSHHFDMKTFFKVQYHQGIKIKAK